MSWAVSTYGEPKQPPVLCLHGFMGQGSDWAKIDELLGEHFFFICPDLPGHGDTPISDGDTLETVTSGLQAVLAQYNAHPAAVLGYSMGGRLALQFALEAPEQVSRLILESASPGIDSEELRTTRQQHDDALAERLAECAGDEAAFKSFLEDWYSQSVFASLHTDADARTVAIAQRMASSDPAALAQALRQYSTGRQPSYWHDLERIAPPTLCITGEKDRKFCRIAEAMSEATPRIAAQTLTDCGHNVHLERPKSYTTVIRRFLHSSQA